MSTNKYRLVLIETPSGREIDHINYTSPPERVVAYTDRKTGQKYEPVGVLVKGEGNEYTQVMKKRKA